MRGLDYWIHFRPVRSRCWGKLLMDRLYALPPSLAPRLINREAAATYVNVSPNTFDEMVKLGKMPKPKRLSLRRYGYDVRELDMAVDRLPVAGESDLMSAGVDERSDASWAD